MDGKSTKCFAAHHRHTVVGNIIVQKSRRIHVFGLGCIQVLTLGEILMSIDDADRYSQKFVKVRLVIGRFYCNRFQ